MTEGWQRQRFFEAVTRTFRAAPQPLALFIDDLQWCDGDTLAWVHHLMREESRCRVLILVTLRPEEVGSDHPLHNLRRPLEREGRWQSVELATFER